MRAKYYILGHALCLALLASCSQPRLEQPRSRSSWYVDSVYDGDTLWISNGFERKKVRLAGIDAPEIDQPYGAESRDWLLHFLNGQAIDLIERKKDRNERIISGLTRGGANVGLEQIRAGFAWHFKRFEHEQPLNERLAYAPAENEARDAHRGLWIDSHPIPPWDWRDRKDKLNLIAVPVGKIIANKASRVYHTPGCSTYGKVAPRNQVLFDTSEQAEARGFRRAKNCRIG